jgi:cobalt-zinc-cadmium resistance protein CzcA
VLKGILAFGLTRRAIVLLGLLVFVAAGLVAFSKLNIEAYPNPAPVILEITAQAAGLSAEEMERYYTVPMEVGLYITPGVDNIRSTSFLRPVVCARHLQIRSRLLLRLSRRRN